MPKKKDAPMRLVSSGLFFDSKMVGTTAIAKLLLVRLLTDSASGISRMSIRQMRTDLDARLSDGEVESALHELVSRGVVKWDPNYEVAWVINGLRHQARKPSDTLGTNIRNYLGTLPRSPLITEFKQHYREWLLKTRAIDDDEPAHAQLRLIDCEQDPEARIAAAFEQAMPGGNTPEAMRGALQIFHEGHATVDEIEAVVRWWRQHGRAKKIWLKDCFVRWGPRAAWARVSSIVLGREPGQSAPRRRGDAGIDDTRAAFDAYVGSSGS